MIRRWFWWASYTIRPYDMVADRRRWAWQKRARCGWPSSMTPDEITEAHDAIRRYMNQIAPENEPPNDDALSGDKQ